MNIYTPSAEQLGRRRFPDNKEFRKTLSKASAEILSQMQPLLASNYTESFSTNLNILNLTMAREIARLNLSMQAINNDKDYTRTRAEFLQQILGERLGLGSRIAPVGYNDESYRQYLLAIKSADLKGSKLSVLEGIASEFTGQKINIKELYLETRRITSGVGVSASNKMVVQVLIDLLLPGQDLNTLKDNLDFFINLVKPAHTLYDTEFIWTEILNINKVYNILFGDTGGGCVPRYDYDYFNQPVLLAQKIFVQDTPENAMGFIESIHHADLVFYLDNSTQVVVEPGINGTKIYAANGHEITFNDLQVFQYVRMVTQTIPGNFQFWWYPAELFTTPYSQFYKDIYRLPLFQETVKKQMDAQGRFPLQIKTTPTTICDRWVQDTLQPFYEDIRGNCKSGRQYATTMVDTLRKHKGSPVFYWPFSQQGITDPAVLGSPFVQYMEHYPLTDGSSNPALPSDITVSIDGTSLPGVVSSVDTSSGKVYLTDSSTYWQSTFTRFPINGDELTFSYEYLQNGTDHSAITRTVYGVSCWQLNRVPVVQANTFGSLADTTDVTVYVDGTIIPNAVIGINPFYGHVTLNPYSDFWVSTLGRIPRPELIIDGTKQVGDTFRFDYVYGENYSYGLVFDEPAQVMDAVRGSEFSYSMVFDEPYTGQSVADAIPDTIGYRYRMYQLHHSSVLNSDTLALNTYQKPANRASIANKQETLNNYNKVFSGEFLQDTSSVIVLDDPYLSNGLDPILKLQAGTPTFQQTFSYQSGYIQQKKLQDVRKNNKLLMYSDLLMEKTHTGDPSVNLSSICDSDRLSFSTKIGEDAPELHECTPWILFDTVETEDVSVSIPGNQRAVPNLRVSGKNLRENFILREVEETGTALFSYSFTTDPMVDTTFSLPATYEMLINDDYVDFPTLPVVNFDGDLATIADISCTLNGIPHPITGFDAVTGIVSIADYSRDVIGEVVTLTEENIETCSITLQGFVTDPANVSFTTEIAQIVYKDFKVLGESVTWYFSDLKERMAVGDRVQLMYNMAPARATVEFTYHITNSAVVTMINREHSRIMDNGYVFAGPCFDQDGITVEQRLNEYYSFLDDDSDSVKLSFFNRDTLIIEEHIFSGPVFEIYTAVDDEIGAPGSFPNALIKIQNPLSLSNPLNYSADYGFMNDSLVRFRKKKYQELLPDRTFRTMELVEMLPI